MKFKSFNYTTKIIVVKLLIFLNQNVTINLTVLEKTISV